MTLLSATGGVVAGAMEEDVSKTIAFLAKFSEELVGMTTVLAGVCPPLQPKHVMKGHCVECIRTVKYRYILISKIYFNNC